MQLPDFSPVKTRSKTDNQSANISEGEDQAARNITFEYGERANEPQEVNEDEDRRNDPAENKEPEPLVEVENNEWNELKIQYDELLQKHHRHQQKRQESERHYNQLT